MLDELSRSEIQRLAPALRRVYFERDQVIARPGEPVRYLHFPVDAFAWSWIETTGVECRPTSVLTVGRRGVLEWNRVLESAAGETCTIVVSAGSAWRLPIEVFDQQQPYAQSPLRRMLLRYANACILTIASRLACNSEHNIDQRLARWLLWIADESARKELSITHQQFAEISAIRRPSVSLGLSQLQREHLIESQHGRLRIADRERLEQLVCPCYWRIGRYTEDVFEKGAGA